MRRLLKRALFFWGGGALVLALAAATALQWLLSHLALERNPPPGEVVVVSGRQMHLLCQGQGSPAVILESGLPGTSLGWASVIKNIASFTRVCAYDRAGYGWSEAGPDPRTISNITKELADLLRTARVDPPYVLAGHSFGGLVVPSGQRIAANHSPAVESSGNRRTTSTKEIPFRNHLPGPFCGISDLLSTRFMIPKSNREVNR